MIRVINQGLVVEKVNPRTKIVTAKAVRANKESNWFIGKFVNDRWFNVAEIQVAPLNEVEMRKIAVAILEAIT